MWPADWKDWKERVQILIHIKNDLDCDKHQNCSRYARTRDDHLDSDSDA